MTQPSWRLSRDDHEHSDFDPVRFVWLTQLGTPTFKETPRWHREIDLSMQSGRHNANVAARLCFRRPPKPKDRVRFFRVRDLIATGYLPYPAPLPGNPDHAHVRAPLFSGDQDEHQAWWDREERVTLQELARD